MELIVVTGLSGAGRHSVLGALEDSGCTALDNVPPRLLEPLLELETKLQPTRERLVVGMDSRQADFTEEFAPLLDRLRARNVSVQVVFAEAGDDVLLRRYSETRRPHHLALLGTAGEGIRRERELLAPIRALATTILDTSQLSLSELRLRIAALVPQVPSRHTAVRLLSFGYKRGIPGNSWSGPNPGCGGHCPSCSRRAGPTTRWPSAAPAASTAPWPWSRSWRTG
ncbi:MAG: hypothetical protein H6P99_317 [Holophagaceae bacterium]|nr:hypothetical protein [Holophagaceae bacterium]